MIVIRRPWEIIRANVRTYAAVNVVIYGSLFLAFVLGAAFPRLADAGLGAMTAFASTSPLGGQVESAPESSIPVLAGVILISTLVFGALGMATIPSLLIPCAGVIVHIAFAFLLGLTYAPQDADGWVVFGAHLPTLLLELQGYILVLLGSVLLARYWLHPRAHGLATRRAGYIRGLVESAWLYVPALVVLVAGAVYEAIEFLVILA
ncbi:hypothetical protein [Microbacterium sp. EST19A]|uniref:hypothetical protein n=1 Tax=Microbacterium sp. EST19A TaxID=2862681 RepID=UPI001CBC1631|nr:hypothetical protein [Microbacterium sp. EST19A]